MGMIYDVIKKFEMRLFWKYFLIIVKQDDEKPGYGKTVLSINVGEYGSAINVCEGMIPTQQALLLARSYSEMYATDLIRASNLTQNDVTRWNELVEENIKSGIDHPCTRASDIILRSVETNMINNLEKEKDKDVA